MMDLVELHATDEGNDAGLSDTVNKLSTVLEYLYSKEKLKKFEPTEELIFFPEVSTVVSCYSFTQLSPGSVHFSF